MSKNITAASNVIPFDFRGESVRAFTIDGEPWFVAADVCAILGQTNTTKALQSLDEDERSNFKLGRQGEVNIISESGLYTLILRCRDAVKKGSKPHAFRKWVTAEVLPAIRKHGRYIDENSKMDSLVGAVIGTSGVLVLDRVIEQKASPVPQEQRRSFKHTMKSRLRNRFNVQRTDLIPAEQLADACNFIAAYAIEGEWLPKEEKPNQQLDIHYPVSRWLKENPIFARQQEPNGPGSLLISAMMLYGLGSSSPTQELLDELEEAGYNVEACRIEQQAMKYHLERMSNDISEIQRKCFVGSQAGLRFRVGQEVAA